MKFESVNIDNVGQTNQTVTPIVHVEPKVEPDTEPKVEPTVDVNVVTNTEPNVEPKTEPTVETPALSQEAVEAYIKEKYKIESLEEALKPKEVKDIPSDVEQYLTWRNEKGGGTMDDYLTVTKDWSNSSDSEVLNAYMQQSKPHLDNTEREFEINRLFAYDKDIDTDSEIMAKKIAKKDFLNNAKSFFAENSKNFTPARLADAEIPSEYKEAFAFKKNHESTSNEASTSKQAQRDAFQAETNAYFSETFKGFDFKVGENESKVYTPSNVEALKTSNSDLTNMLSKYVDKDGTVKDVAGYHKAISIASDPDSFAKFFYDQGKSEGVTEITAASKNRNLSTNATYAPVDEGSNIRRVDIDNSGYKFKLRSRK